MHLRSGTCEDLFPGEGRDPASESDWAPALGPIKVLLWWGPCAGEPLPTASLGGFRNRVLPFILEPVGAGGHDDLVALLVGEAVFGEDPAFVLLAVALALAALLG